jgi:hypothetical protein
MEWFDEEIHLRTNGPLRFAKYDLGFLVMVLTVFSVSYRVLVVPTIDEYGGVLDEEIQNPNNIVTISLSDQIHQDGAVRKGIDKKIKEIKDRLAFKKLEEYRDQC